MNTLSDKELLAIYNRGDDWSMIDILRDVQSAILAANPPTESRLESGWIPSSHGMTFPCLIYYPPACGMGDRQIEYCEKYCHPECSATHFYPITLPPPPVKEQTECEKAWRKHLNLMVGDQVENFIGYSEFTAGYEAAQKEKGEK